MMASAGAGAHLPRAMSQAALSALSALAAPGRRSLRARLGDQPFALGLLAGKFASAANRLTHLAHSLFGRFFICAAALHLAEHAFTLEFLFQGPQGLVDIVVSDDDLQGTSPFNGAEISQ